jgi:hypothetical protein
LPTREPVSVEAMFAAGLLAGDGTLSSDADPGRLAKRLSKLVEVSAAAGPSGPLEPPTWVAPDPAATAELSAALLMMWRRIAKLARKHGISVLYVQVMDSDDAVQLAQWHEISTFQLVASMPGWSDIIDVDWDGITDGGWRELYDRADTAVGYGAGQEILIGAPEGDGDFPPLPPPLTPPETDHTDTGTSRQLIAEMLRDRQVCNRVLAPGKVHVLTVRIAIPRPGQRGITIDEGDIEFDERGAADLIIDVTSDDGTFHAVKPMLLPQDRTRSSTTAAFNVPTGTDGSIVQLHVTVLYRNRPIRAGLLVASVRDNALPDDEIQFWAVGLSAASEPTPITPADAALDDNGQVLSVRGAQHGDPLPLDDAEKWSAAFEQEASQVLGNDSAPDAIDTPDALRLLVRLARRGGRFAERLSSLGLQNAQTISVMVRADAPVLPLELAYDGPTPTEKARLCDCMSDGPDRRSQPCTRPRTTTRVCPWAFWGMSRVIARTVNFGPIRSPQPRPPLGQLALRPVVYAAAKRADFGSPANALPSDLLADVLTRHAGYDQFIRVKSWRAWQTAVKRTNPQLLVVLGHTDEAQSEVRIEIGKSSLRSQPDISPRDLGRPPNPAPVVLLFACDSALSGDVFGGLPATFISKGAAAVVATLTKFKGRQAADACIAVVSALYGSAPVAGLTLGSALTQARRNLVANGLLVGLLLVAVGEIDLKLVSQEPTCWP